MKSSTGLILIVIGLLSYVLPLMGRQFTIVWLLNVFTFGLGGIICIVVGALIIYVGMQQQKKVSGQQPVQVNAQWLNDKKD